MISVVKVGGNVVDDPLLLADFLDKFSQLDGVKVLVHGGGKIASEVSASLGLKPQMVDGRRITDARTLDVVTMVYAGLVGKRLVAALQSRGCNALGLSGADANLICGAKRAATPVDYGFVADLSSDSVNVPMLRVLIDGGITPVFSAIVHDGAGQLLNCNADTVASSLAIALSACSPVRLIYCFEKRGVLRDVNDESSVISRISYAEYQGLKSSGVIAKGMIPKLQNAFDALHRGVASVIITQAENVRCSATGTLLTVQ